MPWMIFALLLLLPGARAADHPEAALRLRLLRDYGIEAVDKTDAHSPAVLASLLLLLDHAFPPVFVRELGNLRFLFAYAGHDSSYDLGAFHPEARAISVPGRKSFPGPKGDSAGLPLLATLAHEIGHAYALDKLEAAELRQLGVKYGGWPASPAKGEALNHYDSALFAPHPLFVRARELPGAQAGEEWKRNSLCSRLATKNVHEWFADAFAAVALQRLGRGGFLGKDWRARLLTRPHDQKDYWSNYNWVSAGFTTWLEEKARLR